MAENFSFVQGKLCTSEQPDRYQARNLCRPVLVERVHVQIRYKEDYHYIEILKQHQTFLSFPWNIGGKTRYFVFSVLPLGLTSAPFVFTKDMECLAKFWE